MKLRIAIRIIVVVLSLAATALPAAFTAVLTAALTTGCTSPRITAYARAPRPHFDPRSYGAKADGVNFDTEAIQKAIDACAGTGGSVVLAPGKYLTKPLELRGNMTLHLEKGAILLGSPDIADYPVKLPEGFPVKSLCRGLLYAEKADGLTISGQGEINGNNKAMNIGEEIRKVGNEKDRPALLRVFRSPNVTVRDITFRDPCMWTTLFNECDNLLIDGVTVDAPPNCANLSGLEISDSHKVVVRHCDVRSEDDGICFKTFPGSGRGLKNVLVENNTVCSYKANAIKLGFWTYGPVSDITIRNNKITYAKYAGLSLASVHGAPVRNITVDGLEIRNVGQPVFIRLGNMARMGFAAGNREGEAPGSLEDITISNLRAISTNPDNGPACVISGIPGARIKNVRITDSHIEMPGGLQGMPALPPEKEDAYPQSNMFWNTPGYAFFVRHADGVVLENVTVTRLAPDKRPWLSKVDAEVATINCREAEPSPSAKPTQQEKAKADSL
jgi:polygalacturonase